MKTRFLLIRHAESEAKARGIVQGAGLNVPLTARGREQLLRLGETVSKLHFDSLFTSEAVRAQDTASTIREIFPNVPRTILHELNERSKGNAEGMTNEEFKKKYPDIISAWAREEDPRIPGGENFEDVEVRVMPLLNQHVKTHAGQSLLYVGHGNVFRVIVGAVLGIPIFLRNRLVFDHCALTIIEYDHEQDRWQLVIHNQPLI
jgi:broad specificity phosphatase PhoE